VPAARCDDVHVQLDTQPRPARQFIDVDVTLRNRNRILLHFVEPGKKPAVLEYVEVLDGGRSSDSICALTASS